MIAGAHAQSRALSSADRARTAPPSAMLSRSGATLLRGLRAGRHLALPQLAPRLSTCGPLRAAGEGGDAAAAPAGRPAVVGKTVLAQRLSKAEGIKLSVKEAGEVIDTLLDDIMLSVAEGETVTIPGFGSFKKRSRSARKGRNPNTGEEIDIPAKDAPAFSAGSAFKGVVQTGSWEAYDALVAEQKAAAAAKKKK